MTGSRVASGKVRCLIQANCIGPPLRHLLAMSPGFSETYDVTLYTNYTKEPVPESELRSCGLFIHQFLDEKWNELSSSILTDKVGNEKCISIPSVFWRSLWPFWTWDHERMKAEPGFPSGRHPYGDSYILKGLNAGVAKQEIVRTYLELDLKQEVDLDAILAEDCARELDRERHVDIKVSEYIAANLKSARLMTSVNHPTHQVILNIANGILGRLQLPRIAEEVLDGVPEFGEYHVPLHPAVIRHFGLSYARGDSRYLMNGQMRTFREYVECYIDNT